MRNRKWELKTLVSVLALVFLLSLMGLGLDSRDALAEEETIKVAFVYVGPTGDAGWTYRHDQARQYLERKLPYVKTSYVESVFEGADVTRVLTDYARKGYKVIFATAAGYLDFTREVSRKFPETVFMNIAAWSSDEPNVGQYYGRLHEGRYLTGIVSGKMTKSNIIGFVAAHPIPGVIFAINGFALGVRSVNPDARVKVVWTNTWYDPNREKQASLSLVDIGADVIAQHQDTPSSLMGAAERGKYGIGSESDMSKFAPNAYLTGTIWDWGDFYVKTVKEVKNGTWVAKRNFGGLADGMVSLGPFGPMVPKDVQALVEQKKNEIISGDLRIFEGPIKDNAGKIRIPKGAEPPFDEIYNTMDWVVEGVEVMLPKK
ncbi:MAG: BMP family ABC transporter substrate-binding protein [candidate division Zixibacteria bacterium]|nr:BMP family ABC transporter substrate-binding protein [candidate division Zixibacteria bacterium]